MQKTNPNPPIRLTGRNVIITEAMAGYFRQKVARLHFEYPRIVDVHAILDVQKYRHTAEVILHCTNHITIKAGAETDDMYASLDQVVDRVAGNQHAYPQGP
jgi:putative sigma-54 modulation protein